MGGMVQSEPGFYQLGARRKGGGGGKLPPNTRSSSSTKMFANNYTAAIL